MSDLDIYKIRTRLGLSQLQMATKIGVSIRTIQNWEKGAVIPLSKHAILRDISGNSSNSGIHIESKGDMNMSNNNINVVTEKFIDELSAQRRLTEKAHEQMDRLLTQLDRAYTLLEIKSTK